MTLLEHLTAPHLAARQDFSAAFVAMNRIKDVLQVDAHVPVAPVFTLCEQVVASPVYQRQKQAYFLYQVAAEALQLVALRPDPGGRSADRRRALALLNSGMDLPNEAPRRAMAEALGMLPLAVDKVPVVAEPMATDVSAPLDGLPRCDVDWLAGYDIHGLNGWVWQGRSLLAETRSGEVLVVKCLQAGEAPAALCRESAWMDYLRGLPEPLERPFHIPWPLVHEQGVLVQAPPDAPPPPDGTALHPKRLAMDRFTFTSFLESRGLPRKAALRKTKGQRDIVLMTGPHLGGFNQAISLPELIDFAAAGAARCVAGRFCKERGLLS